MTEMFGEAWSPMSVPDLAPDDDDDIYIYISSIYISIYILAMAKSSLFNAQQCWSCRILAPEESGRKFPTCNTV